ATAAGLGRRCPEARHGRGAQWRGAAGRTEVGGAAAAGPGRAELARRQRAAGRLAAARAGSSGGLHGCAAGGTISVARSLLSRSRSAAGCEARDALPAATLLVTNANILTHLEFRAQVPACKASPQHWSISSLEPWPSQGAHLCERAVCQLAEVCLEHAVGLVRREGG
ncbi:hypothetical protein LEMLEM_LOCUS17636, partial [Lemmus lemmus]